MAVAALGLHELRSAARLGEHAQPTLVDSAHGYVDTVTVLVSVLAAAAAAHLLVRLVAGWRSAEGTCYAPHHTLRLWRLASIVLVCVCFGQELLESVTTMGHSPGLAGLLGHGGWTAVPFAILFGGGVALAVRGSDAAIAFAGRPRHRNAARRRAVTEARRLPSGHPRPREPLADLAAGRAPPRTAAAF
jgi:hypothetical protein